MDASDNNTLAGLITAGSTILTGIVSLIGAILYNNRKQKISNQNDFTLLADANNKFRDEVRGDLKIARDRIDNLEKDLDIAKKTIVKMDAELEEAKATIVKLEFELTEKNILIHALTRNTSKNI
jgi:hypothetical protein